MTARGSGDHQTMRLRPYGIGNSPRRYAASIVPGSRSPPMPTMPSWSALSGDGSAHRLGGGSTGSRRSGCDSTGHDLPAHAPQY